MTKIGCITGEESTIIKTVSGYWERFEICNSSLWFVAFYVKAFAEYNAFKRKCPANSVVQPITAKKRNTYAAIRGPAYFLPAHLFMYYSKGKALRISIDKRWLIRDLYQICKNGIFFQKD